MTDPTRQAEFLARQLTVRQLRVFHVVARLKSFSRAAEELSLTQPALSASVRDLEQVLATRLFDRTTHRVTLTDAGAAVLPVVTWLLNSYSHGMDDLHRILSQQSQPLRLGAVPSAMHLLAPALARWRTERGDVRVEVSDMLGEALFQAICDGEIDIGLGWVTRPAPEIAATDVGTDQLVALLPRDHPLADRPALRWQQLKDERLAVFSHGTTHESALALLQQQGFHAHAVDRLQYSESLYSLVRAGLAVGLLSRLYAQGINDAALRAVPLGSPSFKRRVALMMRKEPAPRMPAAADCFRFLSGAIRC
ncbi:LysR family transcriptional regulator [Cupriavidus sp. SK-4]|uniref:LysR family transcriptional regulator n=1 Tax=Cupriavidus sp. SK-4 TaxID=574750 RepID=UPI00044E967C|nr:LysR family transcriptional regulator [Cupriavidus sp. SK-4]EYS86884.1 LysR family transcriptional regulator [Cupriavidus sp. SK-4]